MSYDYYPVQDLLNLLSLSDRMHVYNLSFFSDILTRKADSPTFLPQVTQKSLTRSPVLAD